MEAISYILALWNFFSAHWVELGVALGYVVAAARIIVKLTPTPEDDSFLEKVIAIIKHIGFHLD